MVRAIGDAPPERRAWLSHDEAEGLVEVVKASDRRHRAGKSAADHAQSEWRIPHRSPQESLPPLAFKPNQGAQ